MKILTITFNSDVHCEAVAKHRGWTDEVRNPAHMKNPKKAEMIKNPETAEEYLGRIIMEEFNSELRSIAKDKASEELGALVEEKANAFLGENVITTAVK